MEEEAQMHSKHYEGEDIPINSREVMDFFGENMAEFHNLYRRGLGNVLKLLDQDCTIPFIARYRRNLTGGMDAEQIREVQRSYRQFKEVKVKAENVIKKIKDQASAVLIEALKKAKSVEEVQELYAPFKKGGKGTLAERARKLGLHNVALEILQYPERDVNFASYVKQGTEGLSTMDDVNVGVKHILADIVAKDEKIKDRMKDLLHRNIYLKSKATSKAAELDRDKKFQLYYDFNVRTSYLKPHQILALNRGEQQKVLSIKLEIQIQARKRILDFIQSLYVDERSTTTNQCILIDAIEDSFKRLIEKTVLRHARAYLTKSSEHEAINVFSNNLKRLLFTPPIKNKIILGIDPGFKNGCKMAVIDSNGFVLETAVIHPFTSRVSKEKSKSTIADIVERNNVDVVGIGNGTACRQTEMLISDMIKDEMFGDIEVSYCIVNESGASVYSVTKEAKEEFPDMDPNLVSAVSIGRRLQDPLLELVKIEARHIGVGMYQHDIDCKRLRQALEEVLEDCVSFVGVNLNACSVQMLRQVAGLTQKQAENVIEYREKHNGIINRKELLTIKGIGQKTYQNCAGFVRITQDTKRVQLQENNNNIKVGKKRKLKSGKSPLPAKKIKGSNSYDYDLLDQTWIHPESYDTANKFLDMIGATPEMIGSDSVERLIKEKFNQNPDIQAMAYDLGTDFATLQLIIDGLQQPSDFDIRASMEKPVFKSGITSMEDLKVSQQLTGVITNVTSFGAFVDIGVDKDGLIHCNNFINGVALGPGDKIECVVVSLDLSRERIGLRLTTKISKDMCLF